MIETEFDALFNAAVSSGLITAKTNQKDVNITMSALISARANAWKEQQTPVEEVTAPAFVSINAYPYEQKS